MFLNLPKACKFCGKKGGNGNIDRSISAGIKFGSSSIFFLSETKSICGGGLPRNSNGISIVTAARSNELVGTLAFDILFVMSTRLGRRFVFQFDRC